MTGDKTIRVFIPLTLKKRNGRPRIVAPAEEEATGERVQDPHVLRALGRAWSWRRRLESGAAATLHDIALAEDVSDRYVGRMIRLAYLAPDVLEQIVVARRPISVSISELTEIARLPWSQQMGRAFK